MAGAPDDLLGRLHVFRDFVETDGQFKRVDFVGSPESEFAAGVLLAMLCRGQGKRPAVVGLLSLSGPLLAMDGASCPDMASLAAVLTGYDRRQEADESQVTRIFDPARLLTRGVEGKGRSGLWNSERCHYTPPFGAGKSGCIVPVS